MQSISLKQARKLVLLSQGIHRESEFGRGMSGLVKVIEHLGYIQIDTISVVERAHHHTCWNRMRHYSPDLLDIAVSKGQVFEYWSHAAAYLPMRDYRFTLPRKHEYLNGKKHWYEKNPKHMQYVIDRIRAEGPLQAKDFDQKIEHRDHAWGGHKPAKMALEQLFMQGDVMVAKRNKFQKVFDLTERVVPGHVDQRMPSKNEYYDYLILRFLQAHGIGTAAEIAYLRTGLKSAIQSRCQQLQEDGQIEEITVADKTYYAFKQFERLLNQKLSQQRVKILSPFDNLLIQRQRMRDLFKFDYQIECYVSAKQRRYGYFVLPILLGQNFFARMDAKIDRKAKHLQVMKLVFESQKGFNNKHLLDPALNEFMRFNGGETRCVDQVLLS